MPLLSCGSYQASVSVSNNVYATAIPASFFYFPANRLILGGGLLYLLLGFFRKVPVRQREDPSRFVVLIPGVLGLCLYFFNMADAYTFAIPLQAVTVSFLVWYALRARRARARFLTMLVCILLTVVNVIEDSGAGAIVIGFFYGMIVALPIVILHRLIQNGVSPGRVISALILGLGAPFMLLLFFTSLVGAPVSVMWYTLLFFAASSVPFACLVMWNTWARDVAMGYYREDPVEPESFWLKEIDNP